MDPVGWMAGAVTNELLSAVRDAIKKRIYCKKCCQRLENTLQEIIPIFEDISQTGAELPQHRQKQFNDFYDKLTQGTELLQKCSETHSYNVYRNIRYSTRILALEKYISSFFWRQGWAHILADMHHLKVDVENHFARTGQETNIDSSFAATTNLTADEIIEIKSYCNERHEIGEGSFGKVYRSNFRGKEVAVQKMKSRARDSRTLVENEVRLLHGKDHKNLISLIGWCIEERVFYLVYEYVNGCTLEDYLRENSLQSRLGWKKCFRIIQDIAEGIQFLHDNKIIHVDIKPQNLMLDSVDEEVKIIDFGFSRHVNWDGTHRSTDRIIGTRGYWAPEYCFNHNLSYKHDVYSFGIVVLEVITGQKHVDNARGSSQFHIPDYVKYMIANNRFEEAVDERIKQDSWDEHEVKRAMEVAELALRCADKDKEERPHMDFVVRSLNSLAIGNNGEDESEIVNCSCVEKVFKLYHYLSGFRLLGKFYVLQTRQSIFSSNV